MSCPKVYPNYPEPTEEQIQRLESSDIDELDRAICELETRNVSGDEKRERVYKALLKAAYTLLEKGGRMPCVWSAIRTWSAMVPVSEYDDILPFLHHDGDGVIQVSLQSIIWLLDAPAREKPSAKVQARVEELARQEWPDTPHGNVLAMNSYVAARLCGVEGLKQPRILFRDHRRMLGMPTDVKPWE